KLTEYIIHIHSSSSSSETSALIGVSIVSELVITSFLLSVAQNFIRFGCQFKIFFRFLVSRIFVWVKFYSFFSVCFFDFFWSSALAHSQYFIKIFFHLI